MNHVISCWVKLLICSSLNLFVTPGYSTLLHNLNELINQRRRFNGVVIYIMWNLWKERNSRIFENVFQTVQQVAYSTKEDIVQRHRAMNFGVEAN